MPKNGSNWPTPDNGRWRKGNTLEWFDPYSFLDTIWAIDNCYADLSPNPTAPNSLSENSNKLYYQSSQKIFSGSTTTGQGQLIQSKTMNWYEDHGRVTQ
jgi:hypothetical protein